MIDPLSSSTGTNLQSSSATSALTNGAMGKDDFLKLMVAQMQAQDPMDPMDNADFSAQLAQFSALEQMQNVNKNIEDLILLQLLFILQQNQIPLIIYKKNSLHL